MNKSIPGTTKWTMIVTSDWLTVHLVVFTNSLPNLEEPNIIPIRNPIIIKKFQLSTKFLQIIELLLLFILW
ncbi:hypothetical protein FCL99_03060 [Mycoplasma bovis]|nr:hypothetical protein [Mycoplasmopsis bovis]